MLDSKIKLDIRIVKFQDYLRRKPDRPFGLYGLGVQYMLAGKSASADKMFTRALKINPRYAPAILSRFELLLMENRFAAAARFFHKHRPFCYHKNIYKKRIHRITSQLYLAKGFHRQGKKIRTQLFFSRGTGSLKKRLSPVKDNPVVHLLLAMLSLKEGKKDERTCHLYRFCVQLSGIDDKLRWDLLQALSKENPDLLLDETIACQFSSIPQNVFGTNYANFLLSQFIRHQETEKVIKGFSQLWKSYALPDKKTLWQYLVFCRQMNIWNPSLFICCQHLLSSGWVDRYLADTLKGLKERKMAENTRELDKILELYGY